MSAFVGLWKLEFTYFLSQDSHEEDVSVRWFVKIRIHVRAKPGQPRRESQRSLPCENSNSRTRYARTVTARMSAFGGLWKFEFTYLLSQDNHSENVSVRWLVKIRIHVLSKPGQPRMRMSAFGGLWKFEFTYELSQDGHGENVSVRWLVKIRIHIRAKPGQPRRECQRSVAYENSNSRTI